VATVPRRLAFPQIVRDRHVCGGEPTIKGTRIPVRSVVVEYHRHHDREWVLQGYPALDEATLQEALAFYEANREAVDQLIAENEAEDAIGD
jgi:uncharacterized protein (DUF433 family)